MPYLGNLPAERFTSFDKQTITGNGGTSYTLDHPVGNEQEIEVFVNNVRQEPSVAYTVAGTALTMTGNVESSDDFYVVFQGKATQTATHPETFDLKAVNGTFSGDLQVDGASANLDSEVTVGGNITVGTNNSLTGVEGGEIRLRSNDGTANVFHVDVAGVNNRIFTTTNNQDILIGQLVGTGGEVAFQTGASERMRVTDNGITFNGDTAAANALDDYEEGTWTPNFEMVSGSASFTYQANGRQGYYTKIGNQVTVWFIIHSAGSTVTTDGNVRITGLPFTSANNHARSYSLGFKQLLDVNEVGLLLAINYNSSKIELFEGHTSYPESNRLVLASYLGSDRRIRGTMTYMV